jgi:uncharacterized protein YxeA
MKRMVILTALFICGVIVGAFYLYSRACDKVNVWLKKYI